MKFLVHLIICLTAPTATWGAAFLQSAAGHAPSAASSIAVARKSEKRSHSSTCTTVTLNMAKVVELEAEPEGGKELTALSTLPGVCRMKQMDELKDIKSNIGTPYQFWMTAQVEGELIKTIQTKILKDASKKANFPGFRKGQVPPYAMPQIMQFSIQEAIINTVQAAVDAFGLKALDGDDGKVEVKEDVAEMSKGFKVGNSLQFTAVVNAAYDPDKQQPQPSEANDEVVSSTEQEDAKFVDVEVVE